MRDPAGEAMTNSLTTFSYKLQYMYIPMLADQQRLTSISTVRAEDVV